MSLLYREQEKKGLPRILFSIFPVLAVKVSVIEACKEGIVPGQGGMSPTEAMPTLQ